MQNVPLLERQFHEVYYGSERRWRLDRHFDHQLLQELLVPVSDRDLSNVRNLSNLPLGLPFIRQHGGDVSGSRSYTSRSPATCEFHGTSNLQYLNRNSLRLSRYGQFVGEPGRIMPVGRWGHKHPQFSQHEPVAPSNVLLVQRGSSRYLIQRPWNAALTAGHVDRSSGYVVDGSSPNQPSLYRPSIDYRGGLKNIFRKRQRR